MRRTDPPRVLITDDEKDMRWVLSALLRQEGYETLEAETGRGALRLLRNEPVDVVLLDLRLPGGDGLQTLRETRRLCDVPVILMTGFGSIPSAVEAMKAGAYGYLTKPFQNQEVLQLVGRAVADRRSSVDRSEQRLDDLGTSPGMLRVRAAVERVAPTDFTVILQGETGTGKEVVARAIHRHSRRIEGPFVPLDCGAIPAALIESELFGHEKGSFTGADRFQAGSFEAARGGTLFLDEIANLPLPMQAKLLRALQERRVRRIGNPVPVEIDVRVIAAAHEDLSALVEAGRFRRDLFHRLNEFRILLPPLRDRGDDLLELAERFRRETCGELGKELPEFSEAVRGQLQAYPWPGNVRELRNVIRRAVLLAEGEVRTGDLEVELPATPVSTATPDAAPQVGPEPAPVLDGSVGLKDLVREHVARTERDIVLRALRLTNGNKARAARLLRVDYKTMRAKAREYGIPGSGDDSDGGQEQA